MIETKPKPQVVKLKTLRLHGEVHTPIRAKQKRVFTEDEWNYLLTLATTDLLGRIEQGARLIKLLESPAMMNVTAREARSLQSNLRYQMDAIWTIIRSRNDG